MKGKEDERKICILSRTFDSACNTHDLLWYLAATTLHNMHSYDHYRTDTKYIKAALDTQSCSVSFPHSQTDLQRLDHRDQVRRVGGIVRCLGSSALISHSRLVLSVSFSISVIFCQLTLYESCFAIIWKVKVLPMAFWKYAAALVSSPASCGSVWVLY
jgi:hypothetical protein